MAGLPIHVASSGSSDFTCQLQAPQVRAPVGEADSMPLFVVHTKVAGHFPSSTLLGPKLMETPRFRGRGTQLKVMMGEPQHHIVETHTEQEMSGRCLGKAQPALRIPLCRVGAGGS